MRKIHFVLMLFAFVFAQQALADTAAMGGDDSDSKPCMTIAKACIAGHYTRKASPDKRLWRDCMKPIILGQTVSGVTVDAATAKSCRDDKIAKMKMELNELQSKQ